MFEADLTNGLHAKDDVLGEFFHDGEGKNDRFIQDEDLNEEVSVNVHWVA